MTESLLGVTFYTPRCPGIGVGCCAIHRCQGASLWSFLLSWLQGGSSPAVLCSSPKPCVGEQKAANLRVISTRTLLARAVAHGLCSTGGSWGQVFSFTGSLCEEDKRMGAVETDPYVQVCVCKRCCSALATRSETLKGTWSTWLVSLPYL